MAASSPNQLPARPVDVAEWEDLLIRLEIMPRVLRNTLEDVPPGDAVARECLRGLVERDMRVSRWLEVLAGGGEDAPSPEPPPAADLRELADRFNSRRARNFAMVQRRGLEVWDWSADFAGHGRVTAHQVLGWLVRQDVQALAELRERTALGTGSC